jgi:predicted pyridoxine 5'-phosphate oxidase superfamily flavin-nucleotide-binding protein
MSRIPPADLQRAVKDMLEAINKRVTESTNAGSGETQITFDLSLFLSNADTAFIATANAVGQPYAQYCHRPKGFIKVLNMATIGFANCADGEHAVTTFANLAENEFAFLFVTDMQNRQAKIWGRAFVVENNPELLELLTLPDTSTSPEKVILFAIERWEFAQ